jgi:DNA methylase
LRDRYAPRISARFRSPDLTGVSARVRPSRGLSSPHRAMATSEKKQATETAASPPKVEKDGVPRLMWGTKPSKVERVALPFQVVETINESRATREAERGSLFSPLGESGGGESGWRNKLIWGDNKLVLGSLRSEFAGKVKLIYIDPPFDTGDDFSYKVEVGDASVTKLPSILEEHAYRDTWGGGKGSYLTMLYERLVLMHELLSDEGSIFIHLDWHQSHYVKLLLDENASVTSHYGVTRNIG